MSTATRVHVIACGVLAIDFKQIAQRLGIEIGQTYLEGGLHDSPTELRRRLQEAIDQVSATGEADRIVVGYGLCGRGTVGIASRSVPLAIPKAHDCIALFLGSDAAYKKEFARFPGTYYISAGWFKEKVQPRARREQKEVAMPKGGACVQDDGKRLDDLSARYGPDNARAILDFLNSWRKNYQRAAFIDTGADVHRKYADYAKAMAQEFGWKYEALQGDLSLLEKVLVAERTTDEVLFVASHHVTAYDAISGTLKALPVWQTKSAGAKAVALAPSQPTCEGDGDSVAAQPSAVRYGLGIDAGGTYTDAVIFDFQKEAVLAKSKALTTKWDFTLGIENALQGLKAGMLQRVGLVSVSTTLATNAIVEGHGQQVGLLVMPPYGLFEPGDIPHDPTEVVSGRLDISGVELEPVDEDQVRRAADQLVARGAEAFAVSGFAGTVNPAHELKVKEVLLRHAGLSVTCGHELSELLNFRERALTAVLNARIIPRLQKFIRQVRATLAARGIAAPIMVVKGDGSLMSAQAAADRPVETILSGPAASVAGARYLTGLDDALVTDMGGTTTDTAAIQGGEVRTCSDGTRVGGHKTHVKALDMRTVGLGGDSLLALEDRRLRIGPCRVVPVAYLASQHAQTAAALDYVQSRLDDFASDTGPMELLALTGYSDPFELTDDEKAVIDVLAERPMSLAELAARTGREHWSLLRLGRLEENHILQRSGLTPTDLLHVRGLFKPWDVAASSRLCGMFSQLAGRGVEAFIDDVFACVVRRLAMELIKKRLDGQTDADVMDHCPACTALLDNLFAGGDGDLAVGIRLKAPIVGIGAPVRFFLPQAAKLLGTKAIVPALAGVANAVGAITSNVLVSHSALVCPDPFGGYMVEGLAGAGRFGQFEQAHEYAVQELGKMVATLGRLAGASTAQVQVDVKDRISTASDGTEIFLGRLVTARLSGRPVA